MSRKITVHLVDAFTTTPGKGNRAGVVLDASGLATDEMQAVAALVNVSETAFMIPVPTAPTEPAGSQKSPDAHGPEQSLATQGSSKPMEDSDSTETSRCQAPTVPEDGGYDLHVRYFTPTTEVPSCGHATIASHFARSETLGMANGRVIAKIGAGILPVDIRSDEAGKQIVMTQGEIVLSTPLEPAVVKRICTALGIPGSELAANLPVQEVSTGHSKIMVPIRSVRTLDSLTPDMRALCSISSDIGCNGFFVFAFNEQDDICLTSGRMFAPAAGIDEDPVTGNGNGPCGAYLVHHGMLPDERHVPVESAKNGSPCESRETTATYRGRQGVAMGSEGMVQVTVHCADGEPQTVQVAGTAVTAGSMAVSLVRNPDGTVHAQCTVQKPA